MKNTENSNKLPKPLILNVHKQSFGLCLQRQFGYWLGQFRSRASQETKLFYYPSRSVYYPSHYERSISKATKAYPKLERMHWGFISSNNKRVMNKIFFFFYSVKDWHPIRIFSLLECFWRSTHFLGKVQNYFEQKNDT